MGHKKSKHHWYSNADISLQEKHAMVLKIIF